MMEGMDQTGQEEYIWAMRYRGRESDREGKDRTASEGTAEQNLKKGHKQMPNVQDDHQTKVLASLVPDEIIYNVNDYTHRHYDACLLFGDVSGFTDLCEKYNKTGKGGPSRLTQVLNSYIGSMVQEIMSYNGDVLKFSGDAFLAMWKSSSTVSMQDAVHDALDCALIIQKSYGTYETDVGVMLRVKLAISAGHVVFSLIGDERFSHYVVMGQPIWDVKAAEHKSSAGEIIVSHTAWNYINPSEYLYQAMSDGLHIKVHGLGANWRSTQKTYRQNKPVREIKEDLDNEESDVDMTAEEKTSNEEFSIRPSVNDAAKLKLKEDLRKFIIPPVMRAVDLDEPVEYLTEMRQIVILFLNIVTHKIEITDFVNLVDKCYKIVCRIVDSMHGCVNKVSLFDKDLMFVVIFGFRGFKHELESQVGLRCATEVFQTVARVKHVKSTSIGVTTGMTYCGVVGHTLRREYTVISLNVNKAARLMVAYPNKVTCDMETFLHSKLESRNFILQEHKELKGITRAGPVYEFKEVNIVERIQHNIHKYPILGRDAELQLYLRMLRACQEMFRRESELGSSRDTALLLKGDARQGLTRLLDEMVYCTPPEIPINRFTLNSHDRKIPYLTMQLIFGSAMGISENSTDKDKREKLVRRLKKVDVPELFCVLNSVFSVNFEVTPLYQRLNNEQKKIATERMIKQLAYGCFSTVWVIAIDNAEQIDAESWTLIPVLFELDLILIVMTMGRTQQVTLTPNALEAIQHPRMRSLKLPSIDKWFHAGLACQVLGVFAIPPELEKVIQVKSNGNPGWIENYLLSLTQGGGLQIKNVFKGDVNELGMVVPPVEMLERQPPDLMRRMLEQEMDQEPLPDEDSDEVTRKNYGWLMFRHCFRDSHTHLMRLKLQTSYIGDAPICLITPGYKIEEVDPEMPMDVFIMKTFDSLSSFEQQLLKCSAVLGETFPRDMLVYILGSAAPRPTALAVQKLFESKILTCAQGDFTQGDTNMMFRQRLSTTQQHIKCECRGLKIHETCQDLPKYASCGYMRFRLPMFRDITYNLLTDNQKKDFHGRGVRYLEKETRKCRSCGNGYFVRFLGTRNEDLRRNIAKERKIRERSASITSRGSVDYHTARRISVQSDMTQISSASRSTVKRETVYSYGPGSTMMDPRFEKTRTLFYLKNDTIGYTTIRRLRRSTSLTRTFSNADFTNCQCAQILNCMYSQMLEHCRGAGLVEKLMDTMLEYAYVCILTYNIPHAMKILDDATEFVKSKKMNIDEEEQEWKIPLMIGKIKTLIGSCRLQLGQMKEAYECFTQAMVLYGYPFPTNKNVIKFYIRCIEFKLCFGLYVFPRIIYSYVEGYEAEFCDNVSECLSLLCNLFVDLEMWEDAELAAAWSLNRCLKSKMDFHKLCIAYGNMILVAHHMGRKSLSIGLEIHALRMCHKKKSSVESQELFAVVKMYSAIFSARFVRSEIDSTISIGFIISRICATIHATIVCLKVLPLLVQALLFKKRIMEAASLLHELEYYAEEDIDNSGRTWFYALCVCINLETGYTVIPFARCEKFYQIEGETMITIRDPDAERRYYTVMWLWCVRNCEWEAAAVWYTKARDFTINPDDNLDNAFTALYLLEGLLLYLVCKMDKRNVKTIAHTYADIKDLISILETIAKKCRTIIPRLTHLKIYFKLIQDSDANFSSMLSNAMKHASNLENILEVAWMEHSEKAWNNNLSSVSIDFWKDHCDPDNLLDYHEVDFNGGKLGLFTLPQPLFL